MAVSGQWILVAADGSGATLTELTTYGGLSLTFTRNGVPECQFSLSHDDDACASILTALAAGTGGGVPTLKAYRTDSTGTKVLRFNGYLATISEESGTDASTATFTFRGPFGRLLGEGSDRGRFTGASTVFAAVDAGVIAKALIDTVNSVAHTGVVTTGSITATKTRDRAYQFANAGEAVTNLTAVLDGFDFEVVPVESVTTTAAEGVSIPNPSFITDTSGWTVGTGSLSRVTTAADYDTSPGGGAWATGGVQAGMKATITGTFTGGVTYRISARVKSDGTAQVTPYLYPAGSSTPAATGTLVNLTTAFQTVSVDYTPGSNTSGLEFHLITSGLSGSPTVYVDTVTFDLPYAPGITQGQFTVYAAQGSARPGAKFEYGQGTIANCAALHRQTVPPVNSVTIIGANGLTSTKVDTASKAKYGFFPVQQQFTDVAEQATIDDKANALLRPNPVKTLDFTPDPRLAPAPWDDYWIGDTVYFYANRGALVEGPAPVRVNQITVAIDPDTGLEAAAIPDPLSPDDERTIRASLQTEVVA